MENTEKKYNKLQWFMYVILIPCLFTMALALVILTIAGINVFDITKQYAKYIPGLDVSEQKDVEEVDYHEQISLLETEIADKEVTMEAMEAKLTDKQNQIEALTAKVEELTTMLNERKQDEENQQEKLREVAKMYEEISPEKAAEILSMLTDQEVLDILSMLKNDTRAKIFEELEPAKAAEYTILLKDS